MTIIVTDSGFARDDWQGGFTPAGATPDDLAQGAPGAAADLAPDADPQLLRASLGDLPMIRVQFPAFADGRGFSIARQLRLMGYTGRLRACGHVLADQYAMARRCGFDEVEIDDALAARQPQEQWLARADWRAHDHRARLLG